MIPPIAPPTDTKYIKHERIQSALLTKFWGRPMHLGANVLAARGLGHASRRALSALHLPRPLPVHLRRLPRRAARSDPEAGLLALASASTATTASSSSTRYQFYKDWTGPGFPRAIVIEIQHPTPFYDDSYAVNSANAGPYGDAIVKELLPYIEKKYRGIGEGWARFMYGGSTGGWEAMAAQVFYPDDFNGAYIACPDPIDFRAYTVVNSTRTRTPTTSTSTWKRTPRPGLRNYLGHIIVDARGNEPARAGARHEDPIGPAVGRVGSDVLAGRSRRLPGAHLGQAHRRHRQEGRRVLARALRPRRTSCRATGRRASARSSKASSTSTSATWTTTI